MGESAVTAPLIPSFTASRYRVGRSALALSIESSIDLRAVFTAAVATVCGLMNVAWLAMLVSSGLMVGSIVVSRLNDPVLAASLVSRLSAAVISRDVAY